MRHIDQIIEAYEKGRADGAEVSQDIRNSEYLRGRVDGAARHVNKIDMIKVIRDTFPGGMSLRDSKDIADRLFEVFGFTRP